MPWLTAFLDVPTEAHERTTSYWEDVTGFARSASRGTTGEFATLLPVSGDAHLRVQRVDAGPGGVHLDVHVPGASFEVRASPGGLPFCVVGSGESEVAPAADWGTHRSVVDQVSIDVPADSYEAECAFWSDLLGAPAVPSQLYDEFRFVEGRPLRVLLQRLDEATGPTRAHLDLATDDLDAEVRRHEALGGRVVRRTEHWTTLVDPAEIEYCVTTRTP